MSGDVDTFAGLAIKKSNGIGVTVIICILITFVLLHLNVYIVRINILHLVRFFFLCLLLSSLGADRIAPRTSSRPICATF